LISAAKVAEAVYRSLSVRCHKEVPLNWNTWIRQTHRWLSIAFTLTVIANFVAMAVGQPPAWVVYAPLPPLALMLFTGLYMFALPYLANGRSGRALENADSGGLLRQRR
jgi:cellulose synthase/poly-beta-1,6-N-acetylglucosamine synthase-like glycosyltransferase